MTAFDDEASLQGYFSKIAFLFLIFAVISGGYMSNILSCQMQKWLSGTSYSRHIVGLLLIFVFIMLEGGWSFDVKKNDAAPNDWSSGNAVETMAMALIIYVLFVLSSKMKFWANATLFISLFLLYAINTQRSFYVARGTIAPKTNETVLAFEYAVLAVTAVIFVYGIVDYALYQMKDRGSEFDYFKFFLGGKKCASLASE